MLLLLWFFALVSAAQDEAPLQEDKPWDVDGPCQTYVENFARAQAKMVQCATNYSIPPAVCTNCVDEYVAFKQVEYETKNLNNVTSRDNRTCTQVIYDNYLLSYGFEISDAISSRIWEKSRCESCIHINWNFEENDTRVDYLPQTDKFRQHLKVWRGCVQNYTGYDDLFGAEPSNETICSACKAPFDTLFHFYWDIYIRPGVEFCVDVETTMNDTFHIWNDVWQCAERKNRQSETLLIVLTSCVMGVLIALFYASSFIQGGGVKRQLVQYSRLDPPRGQRSRLLSSGSEANFAAPSNYSISRVS